MGKAPILACYVITMCFGHAPVLCLVKIDFWLAGVVIYLFKITIYSSNILAQDQIVNLGF